MDASMKRTFLATVVLLFAVTPPALGQDDPVAIKSGFVDGNGYRAFSGFEKRAYAMGLIDGYFLAPLFGAPKRRLEWLERCVVGMTDVQLVAIIDKFLQDHPERWHDGMHALVYSAMFEACRPYRER